MDSIAQNLRLVGAAVVAVGMFGCGASLNGPGTGVRTDGGQRDGSVDERAANAPLICPRSISTACLNGACSDLGGGACHPAGVRPL